MNKEVLLTVALIFGIFQALVAYLIGEINFIVIFFMLGVIFILTLFNTLERGEEE